MFFQFHNLSNFEHGCLAIFLFLGMAATKGICQAGGMRGLDDHRSGLVQEIFRVIDQCPSVYLIFNLLSTKHASLIQFGNHDIFISYLIEIF